MSHIYNENKYGRYSADDFSYKNIYMNKKWIADYDLSNLFLIRAKRVSNCYIQKKKNCACVCACVRLILVLVGNVLCTRYVCTYVRGGTHDTYVPHV